MAQEAGIYRRKDSRFWWIDTTLSNGQRVCRSSKTEDRQQAEAYVAKLRHEAFQQAYLGVKPARTWRGRGAVSGNQVSLRGIEDVRRFVACSTPTWESYLDQINGDVIWSIIQELEKGNKPATVNRYLATVRACCVWLGTNGGGSTPSKVRLLGGKWSGIVG